MSGKGRGRRDVWRHRASPKTQASVKRETLISLNGSGWPVDSPSGGSAQTRGEACSQTPCRRQSMPHARSPAGSSFKRHLAGVGRRPDRRRGAAPGHAAEARRKALRGEIKPVGIPPGRPSIFPPRRPQRAPVRAVAIARRRHLAASGPMPPALAAKFTVCELAVLRIVGDEVSGQGACALTIDEIAARAGVCRGWLRTPASGGSARADRRPGTFNAYLDRISNEALMITPARSGARPRGPLRQARASAAACAGCGRSSTPCARKARAPGGRRAR